MPIGDPFHSASWSQQWSYDGSAALFGDDVQTDLVAFEVLTGTGAFELGGTPPEEGPLYGFSDGTWGVESILLDSSFDAYRVSAIGDPASALSLVTHFEGDMSDGIRLRIATWDAADQRDNAFPFDVVNASYLDGQGWTVQAGTWDITRGGVAGVAPVPTAALLGALGLSLVGWGRRRLR